MRRAISIACCPGGEHADTLYALCDDGSLWYLFDREDGWVWMDAVPEIPQPDKPILDRQDKEDPALVYVGEIAKSIPARVKAIEELNAKAKKALRQARLSRAKKKL